MNIIVGDRTISHYTDDIFGDRAVYMTLRNGHVGIDTNAAGTRLISGQFTLNQYNRNNSIFCTEIVGGLPAAKFFKGSYGDSMWVSGAEVLKFHKIAVSMQLFIPDDTLGTWNFISSLSNSTTYVDTAAGQRLLGMWGYYQTNKNCHFKSYTSYSTNDGPNNIENAFKIGEWQTVIAEASRDMMRLIVDGVVVSEYRPNGIIHFESNNLMLSDLRHAQRNYKRNVRLIDGGVTDNDIEKLNNELQEDLERYSRRVYKIEFPDDATVVAPMEDGTHNIVENGKPLYSVDGGLGGLPNKAAKFYNKRAAIHGIAPQDNVVTVAVDMLFFSGSMPFSFSLSNNIYAAVGGLGFNTNNGDVYGVPDDGLVGEWHRYIFVFRNGQYGDIYIDGEKKQLSHQNPGRSGTPGVPSGTMIINGYASGDGYKNTGFMRNLVVLEREPTPSDIAKLSKSNTIGITKTFSIDGRKKEIVCDAPNEACIAMATRYAPMQVYSEHLIPMPKVVETGGTGNTTVDYDELISALMECTCDDAELFSFSVDNIPEQNTTLKNSERAYHIDSSNVIDTGFSPNEVHAAYARVFIEPGVRLNIGNAAYWRFNWTIYEDKVYIEWREGTDGYGTWNYETYEFDRSYIGEWVDIVIVKAEDYSIQDHVYINGKKIDITRFYTTSRGPGGTKRVSYDASPTYIGRSRFNGRDEFSDAYISRVMLFSRRLGPKNIQNVISGKKYNADMDGTSRAISSIAKASYGYVGLANLNRFVEPKASNEVNWLIAEPVVGYIDGIKFHVGPERYTPGKLVKRVAGGDMSPYSMVVYNDDNFGHTLDRGSYGAYAHTTITGLTPGKEYSVVLNIILKASWDAAPCCSAQDYVAITVNQTEKYINPVTPPRMLVDYDFVKRVQSAMKIYYGNWWNTPFGDPVVTAEIKENANEDGEIYIKIRFQTNQSYTDECGAIIDAEIYEQQT